MSPNDQQRSSSVPARGFFKMPRRPSAPVQLNADKSGQENANQDSTEVNSMSTQYGSGHRAPKGTMRSRARLRTEDWLEDLAGRGEGPTGSGVETPHAPPSQSSSPPTSAGKAQSVEHGSLQCQADARSSTGLRRESVAASENSLAERLAELRAFHGKGYTEWAEENSSAISQTSQALPASVKKEDRQPSAEPRQEVPASG